MEETLYNINIERSVLNSIIFEPSQFEDVEAKLNTDDFYLPRLRYVDSLPYTKDEFERAYNWMVSWDLVGAGATYEDLVTNRI